MTIIDLKDEIFQLKSEGKTWNEIDNLLNLNPDQARNLARSDERYSLIKKSNPHGKPDEMDKKYYRDDGSITSIIRTKRKNKQTFNQDELLIIHGFNPDEFKIRSITSNEWTTPISGESFYNYQSKIVVEPITKAELTHEDMIAMIKDIKPISVKPIVTDQLESFLLIPIYDIHFGHNSLSDMQPLLNSICEQVQMGYEEIVVILGGDIQHTDNFMNTTEHGTQIDTVDARRAFQDASEFLTTLLTECVACSNSVSCVYLPGNHAPSNDWFLVQLLKEKLPQVYFDDEYDDYKQVWLGNHSIFMHHGDKIKTTTRLLEVMVSKFGKEWGESVSRYFITGHFHYEKTLSVAGMTHYQVMSPSKASSYDKKNGYITSEQGVMLFEFDDKRRKAIYYI